MTKKDFVKSFADKAGVSQKDAGSMVESFLSCIEDALVNSGKASFVGWGTFKVTKREERTGINPQTGKKITIAAKNVVKFKAGSSLEDRVN